MKIGVVGNGFVGQATALLKNRNVKLFMYDIVPEKCIPPNLKMEDLKVCDFIFVCVPTPMERSGKCHLGIVENVINTLNSIIEKDKTFIILRSTVPPGTCERLNCYFMPEFLTEKNWKTDFKCLQNWIFGLLPEETHSQQNEYFKKKLNYFFFLAHENNCIIYKNLHFVTTKEAEMIKYFRNTFLTTKVSFCNELEEFCRKKDIDYNIVKNMATLDNRIASSHINVPGHDGFRGYGGTCFPKDSQSLLYQMSEIEMDSYIIKASVTRNETIDRPEKDWTNDVGRAFIE